MTTNKTDDLTKFKKLRANRPLDQTNLSRIIASIKLNNMLELVPILVTPDMEVIDGQHRLEAAKQLNVPIWYTIVHDSKPEDIVLLNANKKSWTPTDYIFYHSNLGNENYKKLIAFSKSMRSDPLEASAFLMGYRHTSANGQAMPLKRGHFIFPSQGVLLEVEGNYEKMQRCIDLIESKIIGPKGFINSRRCRSSLFHFLAQEAVNCDVFVSKLLQRIDYVRPCANTEFFSKMWKDIYNYRNQAPLPD